jgi:hypothetical protein
MEREGSMPLATLQWAPPEPNEATAAANGDVGALSPEQAIVEALSFVTGMVKSLKPGLPLG